jgi:hypothetical protein
MIGYFISAEPQIDVNILLLVAAVLLASPPSGSRLHQQVGLGKELGSRHL